MSTQTLIAIAHASSDYHSGQWSRGYRLWCRVSRALKRRGIKNPLDIRLSGAAADAYDNIVNSYKDKL